MSFREVRCFTERMRALGYPTLVSLESFRIPNFALVAHVLLWLVKSYDPTLDLPTDISTEQDRVIFIKSIVQTLALKAHVKLNPRKLYGADGYAVQELLKLANVLYDASCTKWDDKQEEHQPLPTFNVTSKLNDLKKCRQMANVLTNDGAQLYDLLSKEIELREIRTAAIARPLDLGAMEQSIKSHLKSVVDQIQSTKQQISTLTADENNLMMKIDKKKEELERREKRLKSLQSVRPAFMDEFERLEVDLQKLYIGYMDRYRHLTYLEQQLEDQERVEQDKLEETESTLKRMQMRLREEELRLLRGERDIQDEDIDDAVDELFGADEHPQSKKPNNLKKEIVENSEDGATTEEELMEAHAYRMQQTASARMQRPRAAGSKRVLGSITGGDDDDEDFSDYAQGSSDAIAPEEKSMKHRHGVTEDEDMLENEDELNEEQDDEEDYEQQEDGEQEDDIDFGEEEEDDLEQYERHPVAQDDSDNDF